MARAARLASTSWPISSRRASSRWSRRRATTAIIARLGCLPAGDGDRRGCGAGSGTASGPWSARTGPVRRGDLRCAQQGGGAQAGAGLDDPVVGVEQLVFGAGGYRRRAPVGQRAGQLAGLGGEVLVEAEVEGVTDAQVDERAGAGEHDQHGDGDPAISRTRSGRRRGGCGGRCGSSAAAGFRKSVAGAAQGGDGVPVGGLSSLPRRLAM